jgi:protein TonB
MSGWFPDFPTDEPFNSLHALVTNTGVMPASSSAAREASGAGLLSGVFVLAIWFSCLAIGLIGWWVRYPRPTAPKAETETVLVQRLEVELAPDLAPPQLTPATIIDASAPPPPPDAVPPVNLPAPVAVAAPSPSIAFAIPVEGPVTVVEANRAAYTAPPAETQTAPVAAPAAAPQILTFGTGEGRQPAPEYPRRAIREGQEGTVVVRFVVNADGRVVSAQAHEPSAWPLLNESAVRVVRERWRFRAGEPRAYEVAIRFELKK